MSTNEESAVPEEVVVESAQAPVAPPVVQIPPKPTVDQFGNEISPKSRLAAALLAWFLGVIGIHRFYVGKVGTGILMILTLGGLGPNRLYCDFGGLFQGQRRTIARQLVVTVVD